MARYYDAEVGRFITRDPFHGFVNEPLSLNQYNYAHSNPVIYIDPSGYHAAAVYFIPGIGQVAFTATAIIVGGWAVYKVGSWLWNKAKNYVLNVRENLTAQDIIGKEKKGTILREFPTELLDKTLKEIENLAKKGKANAKKAKKLLNDKRFNKGDNRK
ncbi:uncharacterized protein RhaS with RHS repeats [Alkaliphilus hydrothermalis]|uniref:Uncharacterized protein RhaS with RHS repeats n=2 Tax=Alkaliphilus hydrothermalis TaxID=1482730 RepID=A0ABS2NU01_9FIRM|nr:uncharacterized protein RhaS with RHS repeats [Alkaliphilus hydrothermalis]